jgi:hypothetical protein
VLHVRGSTGLLNRFTPPSETDIRSRKGAEELHGMIARIEIEKLDRIITLLESVNGS